MILHSIQFWKICRGCNFMRTPHPPHKLTHATPHTMHTNTTQNPTHTHTDAPPTTDHDLALDTILGINNFCKYYFCNLFTYRKCFGITTQWWPTSFVPLAGGRRTRRAQECPRQFCEVLVTAVRASLLYRDRRESGRPMTFEDSPPKNAKVKPTWHRHQGSVSRPRGHLEMTLRLFALNTFRHAQTMNSYTFGHIHSDVPREWRNSPTPSSL